MFAEYINRMSDRIGYTAYINVICNITWWYCVPCDNRINNRHICIFLIIYGFFVKANGVVALKIFIKHFVVKKVPCAVRSTYRRSWGVDVVMWFAVYIDWGKVWITVFYIIQKLGEGFKSICGLRSVVINALG